MSHYKANLRDVEFNLFEVFGYGELLGASPWAELDVETAKSMLATAAQLAEEHLGATFLDADFGTIAFDAATGTGHLPAAFRSSYENYVAAEWWRMDIPEEFGGIPAPQVLRWAIAEMSVGANPSVFLYASGWPQAAILARQGNEQQRRFAQYMIDRHWGATMVLTEPDSGSSVGSAVTRAVPQPDGTWHIQGVKRFITSAEHDLADNIAHLVLARPIDTPGAGGPGTKGLSLFLVPKILVDLDSGELGERNGVYVTNIERKMGLKASTTCELTFGDRHPAIGYLVGDVHDGIRQMFEVVEYARMLVGTKAMATLSTAYLNALDYAKTRRQGPDLKRRGDRSAPDIPIIEHPDVRRTLLMLKAYAEGLRALVTLASAVTDQTTLAAARGESVAMLRARTDLLLPIIKGFSSEKAYALLGDCLQIFGGSGYLQDYPMEQYIRDAKVDTIYEGTTAIQGLDLFFRKICRDDGRSFDALMADIAGTGASVGGDLVDVGDSLVNATAEVRAIVSTLRAWQVRAAAEPEMTYQIAWCTTRLVHVLGELVVAWLLVRQAAVATSALEGEVSARDQAFYRGKIAIASWFARERLPLLAAERAVIAQTDREALIIDDASF
jgi:alkylation response protein AidB-like acyl-CoA dehydrogenase